MTNWQPIETAPKDGTRVLISKPGGPVRIAYWEIADAFGWADWMGSEYRMKDFGATHWAPMPEPPCADGEAADK